MAEAEEKMGSAPYQRVNVAEVTGRTAPPYVLLSHTERRSIYVLSSTDGTKLLVGQLGINYFMDGPADHDGVYLRRWDMPPQRGDGFKVPR